MGSSWSWRRGRLTAGLALAVAALLVFHRFVPNTLLHLGSLLETVLVWLVLAVPVLVEVAVLRRSLLALVASLLPMVAWCGVFGGGLLPASESFDLTVVQHNVNDVNPDPAGNRAGPRRAAARPDRPRRGDGSRVRRGAGRAVSVLRGAGNGGSLVEVSAGGGPPPRHQTERPGGRLEPRSASRRPNATRRRGRVRGPSPVGPARPDRRLRHRPPRRQRPTLGAAFDRRTPGPGDPDRRPQRHRGRPRPPPGHVPVDLGPVRPGH